MAIVGLVRLVVLYASKAALKTDRKLDEEEATEAVWDMGTVVG